MNARNELANLIASVTIDTTSGDVLRVHPDGETPVFEGDQRTADAILAAGYRRPRTITTAEELDALGHGSVIRSEHRHYWVAHKEDGMGTDQGWAAAGGSALTSRDLTAWLPATVLYEPEQP